MSDHPIYTRPELTELVTRHDSEHPDHGEGCTCHHGLIPMLRTLATPLPPTTASNNGPKPYVPPDALTPEFPNHTNRKPWLQRREGETKTEYDHRTSHSCYNCGQYIKDR